MLLALCRVDTRSRGLHGRGRGFASTAGPIRRGIGGGIAQIKTGASCARSTRAPLLAGRMRSSARRPARAAVQQVPRAATRRRSRSCGP
eukprot:3694007-Pyramimonas_sp.AAC.1